MKFITPIFCIISLQHVRAAIPSAFTEEFCLTQYTTQSGLAVYTTTTAVTLTIPQRVKVTVTPSVTVTPPASTATSTSTLTATKTLPVMTDSFTDTSVVTPTSTVTATSTSVASSTVTTTTTLAPGNSTVPVPSGFIYPSPTPGAQQKREIEFIQRGSVVKRLNKKGLSPHCNPALKRYPYLVHCYELVETIVQTTITKTATTTKTINGPTATVTITGTTTTTTTIAPPDASTTLTVTRTGSSVSVTITATVTSTNTVTDTATVTPPATSTYYAACAPSNIVSTDYQGRLLQFVSAEVQFFDSGTATSYDCCVTCFKTPNCYGSNYIADLGDQSCELEVGTSCPANQTGIAGTYTWARPGADPVSMSNGPCGTYEYVPDF